MRCGRCCVKPGPVAMNGTTTTPGGAPTVSAASVVAVTVGKRYSSHDIHAHSPEQNTTPR